MAYQAGGKPANTGMPKTPAPTVKVTEAEARSKSWGREGYGSNGWSGASSTNKPGKSVTSPLADELKRAGTDGVLDIVIAKGTAKNDYLGAFGDPQDTSDKRAHLPTPPTTHGMRDANSGPRSGNSPVVPGIPDTRQPTVRKPS